MRNVTCSLAPGIDGAFGMGSAGFAVAALNAASAASRELVVLRGGLSGIRILAMTIYVYFGFQQPHTALVSRA